MSSSSILASDGGGSDALCVAGTTTTSVVSSSTHSARTPFTTYSVYCRLRTLGAIITETEKEGWGRVVVVVGGEAEDGERVRVR